MNLLKNGKDLENNLNLPKGLTFNEKMKLLSWRNPILFYTEITGDPPFSYQGKVLERLQDLKDNRWLLCAGGSTGKTRLLASIALYSSTILSSLILQEPYSVIIESGSQEQSRILYDYLKTWIENNSVLQKLVKGEPLKTNTAFKNGGFIKALPASWKSIFGNHSDLLIIDEAVEAGGDLIDDSIRVVGTSKHDRIILSSTPHNYDSRFVTMWEDTKEYSNWRRFSWNALECPLYTKEKIEEAKKRGDMYFEIFMLGKPYPLKGTMLSMNDIKASSKGVDLFSYIPSFGYTVMGIDFGWAPDPTAIVVIQRNDNEIRVLLYKMELKWDPDRLCDWVERTSKELKVDRINVDSHNKHVIEMLKKRNLPIFPISFKGEKGLMQANLTSIFERQNIKIPEQFVTLLWQLKSYTYETKRNDDLVDCYSDDTEILTEDGWKLFRNVTYEDKIATLNDKGFLEYQLPNKIISYKYKGKMMKVNSKQIDLLVTPNHKMYVAKSKGANKYGSFNLERVEDIFRKHVKYKKNAKWKGNNPEYFTLPSVNEKKSKYSNYYIKEEINIPIKTWLEFFGYFISEGSTSYNKVSISQTDKDERKIVKNCLDKLPFKWKILDNQFYTNNRQLFLYLKQFDKAYEKHIPKWIRNLSPGLLEIFVESYFLGDGWNKGPKATSSKRLADNLQEIFLKTNTSSNISIKNRKGDLGGNINGRRIKYNHDYYYFSRITKHNEPRVNHHRTFGASNEWIEYDGEIWCVTVPNHIIYVRRNGKPCWSGNSMMLACKEYKSYSSTDLYYKVISSRKKKRRKFFT